MAESISIFCVQAYPVPLNFFVWVSHFCVVLVQSDGLFLSAERETMQAFIVSLINLILLHLGEKSATLESLNMEVQICFRNGDMPLFN